jgi:hypothetical protein
LSQEAGDEWRVFPDVRELTETRFDRRTRVHSGNLFTIIARHPKRAPADANSARLRILGTQRTTPTKGSGAFGGTGS